MEVNGREYPLWGQFIERKEEWIGGLLEEVQDNFPQMPVGSPQTKIVDITLILNGEDSAYFTVEGEKYSCGFDVHHGGISGDSDKLKDGWLNFSGYGGHRWRIKKPVTQEDK